MMAPVYGPLCFLWGVRCTASGAIIRKDCIKDCRLLITIKNVWHAALAQPFARMMFIRYCPDMPCMGALRCLWRLCERLSRRRPAHQRKSVIRQSVVQLVMRDAPFYGKEGGITCSGGEATMQLPFLFEVLQLAHKASYIPHWIPVVMRLRMPLQPCCRLLICFCMTSKHSRPLYTKAQRALPTNGSLIIIAFYISRAPRIWLRIPVIPGFNDTVEEMQNIKTFLQHAGMPEQIKLIPYHPWEKKNIRNWA